MTADIAAFLMARLDEEAETARAATPGPWGWKHLAMAFYPKIKHGLVGLARGADYELIAPTALSDVYPSKADADHIARQDPQATLDRVEATKAVVAMHHRIGVPVAPWGDDDELPACDVCWHWPEDFGAHPPRATDWPCPTLRALGSAYRRHPDYRTEWAPDGVGVDA